MEYMHLMGADKVNQASNSMSYSAEKMQSTANQISDCMERHQRFMDEWLDRLEQVLKENK